MNVRHVVSCTTAYEVLCRGMCTGNGTGNEMAIRIIYVTGVVLCLIKNHPTIRMRNLRVITKLQFNVSSNHSNIAFHFYMDHAFQTSPVISEIVDVGISFPLRNYRHLNLLPLTLFIPLPLHPLYPLTSLIPGPSTGHYCTSCCSRQSQGHVTDTHTCSTHHRHTSGSRDVEIAQTQYIQCGAIKNMLAA